MNIARQGQTVRVTDMAELGAANSGLFRTVLGPLVGSDIRRVDIDLNSTEFVDCAGVGALVSLRRLAKLEDPGIEVRLVSPNATVRRLLFLLGLDSTFAIVSDSVSASANVAKETARPFVAASASSTQSLPLSP